MKLEKKYLENPDLNGGHHGWQPADSGLCWPAVGRESDPPSFVHTFEALINGLPEQIALLDRDWTVIVVNQAWRHTAALYGFNDLTPGSNYKDFLARMAAEGSGSAAAVLKGVEEIIAGTRDFFRLVYSGSGAWAGHEFQLRINILELAGQRLATVTRYDVTELVQLRKMREGFTCSVIESQDEERRRMGRELHDSTMQLLAGIGLALGQLKRSPQPDNASGVISEMEDLLVEAQRGLRSFSYLAHPPQLEKTSLVEALTSLVEGFGRRAGLKTSFSAEGVSAISSHAAQVALYRVIQEALSNVHRHAHASEVTVRLIGRRSMLYAVIADDGAGIATEAPEGVGLHSMRARVAELGGRLFVRQTKPGTMLIASLPLEAHMRAVGDLALSA